MADQRRIQRFADMIKRSLGQIIEQRLKDPDKGFITITHVKASPDLRVATVYYTVLGSEEQKQKSQAVLQRSKSFLKNELKPHITTRWMPELRFFYDDVQENAARIDSIINKIKHDDTDHKEE